MKLHHFCPNWTRLTLFIPGPLYPDHDSNFVADDLPREGWTVRNFGTCPGDERPKHLDEPCDEGDQTNLCVGYGTDDEYAMKYNGDTNKQTNKRGLQKIQVDLEHDVEYEAEAERIPILYRIFTRTLHSNGVGVEAPLPAGELL